MNGDRVFHIGDKVVYPNHGVGIIEQISSRTIGANSEKAYNIPSASFRKTCNLMEGDPCTFNGQCTTMFCVDGVCCDTSCTDPLHSCNVPGSVGQCVEHAPAPLKWIPWPSRSSRTPGSPPASGLAAASSRGRCA